MIDSWLESAYESAQTGDYEEEARCHADELDPEDYCRNCGTELDDAGDGYDGLCAECADYFERQKLDD